MTLGAATWIFAYGSLVWRPGFAFAERRRAFVEGWTRRLWQGSPDHRGVPGAPGRVATLVRAPREVCGGCAYLVERDVDAVLADLDAREQAGFERVRVPVMPAPGEPPFAEAIVWVAGGANAHFLGHAGDEALAAHVARSHGPSGSNVEYVLRLRDALAALAIRDAHVERIAELIGADASDARRSRSP